MPNRSIPQCDRSLDFAPHAIWPRAFPAMCFGRWLLTGFERLEGDVIDLSQDGVTLAEALIACYPELGFAELARLESILREIDQASLAGFLEEHGLRYGDRLSSTFAALRKTPREFQDYVDEKKMSARDLAPLLACKDLAPFTNFLRGLAHSTLSKSQAAQALENGVELLLLGENRIERAEGELDSTYLARLEKLRKPRSSADDGERRDEVRAWPWPAQVQGQWQRFGDQAGLEIRLRATSPQDLGKKLERLEQIREKWSCST